MKYINKREKFVKEYKSLNEDSGPFANDIPWGDSLLGRLINHVTRKVSISINLNTTERLAKRLKLEFDNILDYSLVSGENISEVNSVLISSLLSKLKEAVDSGENVNNLIGITDETIKAVNKSTLDEEKKKKLLQELTDFKTFLLEFKDDKDDKDVDKEGIEKVEYSEVEVSSYSLMIKNLRALSLILSNYKKIELGVVTNSKPTTNPTPNPTHNPTVGNKPSGVWKPKIGTIRPVVKPTVENLLFRYSDFLLFESNVVKKIVYNCPKHPKVIGKNGQKCPKCGTLLEELKVRVNPLGNKPGANIDRNNVTGSEDHLTQAYLKLKKDIEILISTKEKGIGIDATFINDIISKSVNTKNKELVKDLYKEINRYLVGDKKGTIQEKDVLFKENIETLSDKNKLVIVAEKIARFTKRAVQFDGQNLYAGLGDLKVPLKEFTDTINKLMKGSSSTNVSSEDSEENKQKTDGEVSSPDDSVVQKIIDYFYKNIDYKGFVMDKTEVSKIKTNLETVSKGNKHALDIDPIIEVLKLFNRAYKLHTTNTIPGGRTGGKVTRSVYNEYTPIGGQGGTSGTSDGPYRNNKIFNVWENAVLDIMKERKYQPIFSKDTPIRVGNTMKPGAGRIFKQLITGLIDGDKLYKDGAQKKFLNQYFGEDVESGQLGITKGEVETNAQNAEKSKDISLSFIKNSELVNNEELKKELFNNKIIKLNGTESSPSGDNPMSIYMFIESHETGYLNISYCKSFHFFKKYIEEQGGSPSINGISNMIIGDDGYKDKYLLRYTKVSDNDFKKLLKGESIEINSVSFDEKKVEEKRVIKTSVSWLCNSDKSLYKISNFDILNRTKSSIGGFKNIKEVLSGAYKNKDDVDFKPISKII